MMEDVMGDKLEETQGHLNQMECQVGQIQHDLSNGWAESGSNAGQWAHLFPRFSRGSVLFGCEAHSARHSECGNSTTSSSFHTDCSS